MSNIIKNIYTYSRAENKIINDNFSTHTDWDNEVFLDIKKHIIEHLRIEQNNKCCYCKTKLGYDIKQVDIEHIIAKSINEKFTFKLKNLALSCPSCNTKKSFNKVLVKNDDEKRKYYPRTGNTFKIIHAHFDNYYKHIEIIDKKIYTALSKKGSETITICSLWRFNDIEKKEITHKARIFSIKFENAIKKGRIITKELSETLKKLIR